jgi:hypothetical protein
LADSAFDSRNLDGKRDRISDWGLGRTVEDYYSQNNDRPDLCKNSVVAKALMKRPEVRSAIGKATIRPVDIQVYAYQRRRRQEQNADRALVEGPGGKVLTNTIAERVRKYVEHGAMIDLMLPDSMAIVRELQVKALKAAKEGKDLPKDYKAAWQVAKTGLDMMTKSLDMIRGDSTLQNILKAQTINQTIIRGIPPEELPKRILEVLKHAECPRCRKGGWTQQEALKVYAQAMGSMAHKPIVDAEVSDPAPEMPTPEELNDDPGGEYWRGELKSRE